MPSTLTEEKCSTKTPGNCHQKLYWCSECESVFCENCWDLQAVHELGPGFRGRLKKRKHAKTELEVADYILSVLEPNLTEEEANDAHVSNVHTKWFGVQIDENLPARVSLKSKSFLDLASGSGEDPSSQHPCLVSFVGETGAGKSTLVNAMMKVILTDSSGVFFGATQIEATTPVIGTKIDSPTSGDVHLFLDPKSLHTTRPLFFADCEGSGGGNGAPLAARIKESNKRFKLRCHTYRARTRKREIITSERCTRMWAVNELYPRILFTFSDVVCLVSKNFRKIENHIVDLLDWADNVFERSLNQPMLPKAIIVVNGVESKACSCVPIIDLLGLLSF
ncbi:hypothetical protein HOY82DRAFT_495229 [Tuber indicum]|nr:hypothetical protein HOY82DRAFT_495229 [Tuber indicum]